MSHDCINLRFLTHGGLYAWEFEKDGHALNVRVEGRLTFNSLLRILDAALAGFGLAYLPEDMVVPHIKARRLRNACWTTGARCFPDITCTTRAGDNLRRRSRCSSRRCVSGGAADRREHSRSPGLQRKSPFSPAFDNSWRDDDFPSTAQRGKVPKADRGALLIFTSQSKTAPFGASGSIPAQRGVRDQQTLVA